MQKVLSLNTLMTRFKALINNVYPIYYILTGALNKNIMQKDYYKENLKSTLRNLVKVNQSIFQSLIDVSMQGDLKEWNDSVPVGEVHNFNFELFKNSSDTNIQLLVKLSENVDQTFESIKNLNCIVLEDEKNVDYDFDTLF